MNPLVLLGALAIVPIVLLTVLRINAAIVFLSLCLGSVLVRFAGSDASSFVNLMSPSKALNGYVIMIALLLLPAIFTMIIMIGTVRGTFGMLLNLLPAISVGLLTVLLVAPLLSAGLYGTIASTSEWHYIMRAQVLVISVGSIVSLLFLLTQRPKRAEHGKHGRHH
jgi:hypothetical protein